jgi:hypothetical protein
MNNKPKQAVIEDKNKKNDVVFDVNFDPEQKNLLKISIGSKIALIELQKLWEFVYTIVTPELAEQIIPMKREEREVFTKQHIVKVQKDLKVGDELVVNCHTDVRKEVADAMRRDLLEKKESPYYKP